MKYNIRLICSSWSILCIAALFCSAAVGLGQGGAGAGGGGAVGGAAGAGGVTGGGVGGSAAGGGSGGIGGGIAGGGIGVNGAAPGGGSLGSSGPMGGTGISSGAGNVGLAPSGGTSGVHSGVIGESPGSTGNPSNSFRGAFPGAEPAPGGGPQGITGGTTLPGLRGRNPLDFGQPRRRGDGRIGQGKGATPAAGDRNPAKMLLDEMNGTHEGRRSGQAAFRGRSRRRVQEVEPFTPPRVAQQAVYFARRGAYEDAIYKPTNGSYRDNARRYDNRVQTAIRRGDTRASLNRRREAL